MVGHASGAIGEFLQRVAADRDAAWADLAREATSAARRVARSRRLQPADVEDVATAVLVRVAGDEFALLVRADRTAPLAAWLLGVARNVLRERRREPRATNSLAFADEHRIDSEARAEREPDPAPWQRLRFESLPPVQAAVMRLLAEGKSERAVACELGTTRDNVHDTKRRAMKRLRSGRAWTPPQPATPSWDSPTGWAERYPHRPMPGEDSFAIEIVRLHALGVARREIAGLMDTTPKAVKELIAKRRAWALGRRGG